MATRVVEGKKPYTGGEAIDIDQNKVISLKLRDENNLIIYNSGDDEIYVDLQLPDGITPTDAFPVGVTTGRVVVADGWDLAGTIICAKTTSGDNIKLLYADDGTLWIDNGTGTYKEIPLGGSAGADIEYVTQVEYDALPSSKLTDGKHYVIYTSDSPTPPSPGWQPGVNTLAYYPLATDTNDYSGNNRDGVSTDVTFSNGIATFNGSSSVVTIADASRQRPTSNFTISVWAKSTSWSTPTAGNGFCILGKQEFWADDYPNFFYSIAIMGSKILRAGFATGSNYSLYPGESNITINLDEWNLYTLTNNGTTKTLYMNGVQVLQATENTTTSTYSVPLTIGNFYRRNHDAFFAGNISNVILEDKTWTAQEISDYFNQTKGDYGIS